MFYMVELNLDGYDSVEEEAAACLEFIDDSLNMTASSVCVTPCEGKVLVDQNHYESLEEDSDILGRLLTAGVDNWEGYSEAFED